MSGAPTAEPQEGVAARRVALDIVQQVHAEDAWASPVADRLLSAVAQDFIFLTSFFFVMLWAAVKVTKPKLG